MKTISTILLVFVTLCSKAAVLTVSNNPLIVAQYTDAQSAYEAASDGDELYLHGSPGFYSLNMTSKKVTVTGPGFNPSGQNNLTANFSLFLSPTSETNLDGIVLNGLQIAQISAGNNDFNVDNLTMYRCLLNGFVGIPNNGSSSNPNAFNCIQSIVNSPNGTSYTNAAFINCLIYSTGSQSIFTSCSFSYCDFVDYIWSNNLIFSGSLFTNCNIAGLAFSPFTGGGTSGVISANSCVFVKSVFTASSGLFPSTNVYQNCLFDATSLYQDASLPESTGSGTQYFIGELDLRLASNSPAINFATDGTNTGITGGTQAFDNIKTQGNSTLPKLNSFLINSAAFQQNGSIQILFEATKQD